MIDKKTKKYLLKTKSKVLGSSITICLRKTMRYVLLWMVNQFCI